jgi:hypothetical protein
MRRLLKLASPSASPFKTYAFCDITAGCKQCFIVPLAFAVNDGAEVKRYFPVME